MKAGRASNLSGRRTAHPELDAFLADVDDVLAGNDLRRSVIPTWPPRRPPARHRIFPRGVFGAPVDRAA